MEVGTESHESAKVHIMGVVVLDEWRDVEIVCIRLYSIIKLVFVDFSELEEGELVFDLTSLQFEFKRASMEVERLGSELRCLFDGVYKVL